MDWRLCQCFGDKTAVEEITDGTFLKPRCPPVQPLTPVPDPQHTLRVLITACSYHVFSR